MRVFLRFVLLAACGVLSGCAAMQAGREMAEGTADMMTPKSRDYRDDANFGSGYKDEWSGYGREGRAHMPLDRESDGLTQYLESPKAREINRSLGID